MPCVVTSVGLVMLQEQETWEMETLFLLINKQKEFCYV